MTDYSASAILQQIKSFQQMGSVLYIAAHPDDENTELLAYLARGRNYRTAYLSLTRGDGGQNVLKSDIGAKLGVARTQELLAARNLDGAQQFFSRAFDFGFSKSYEETLNTWNRKEVLSDTVRIIRKFRPDVLITRFSPSPGGTHGHHTASAVLAEEAFKLAGDPKAFPDQGLPPWQPKRIFWNVSTFQKDKAVGLPTLKIDIGGTDPVSGDSFKVVAEKSRGMHKTQGFDTWKMPGADKHERTESFHLLDGEPATTDIMDGVDTTWNRVPGGAPIQQMSEQLISHFNAGDPSASVPALLKLRQAVADLHSPNSVIAEKQHQLDRILQACIGLKVETTIPQSDVVPGEQLRLHHSATITSNVPVRWISVQYPSIGKHIDKSVELIANQPATINSVETLPPSTEFTQPWWLKSADSEGNATTSNAALIGMPENPPAFPIEQVFEVNGQRLSIPDEPVHIATNGFGAQERRRMVVIPPVSLRFANDVTILTPGASKTIAVEVTANRGGAQGVLKLDVPHDWKVSPQRLNFHLANAQQRQSFEFRVTAPMRESNTIFTAHAEVHGHQYSFERQEIAYHHIPTQTLQPPATMKAIAVDLKTKGTTVGYIPGAGDSLVENMEQMGYTVKVLDDADLTAQQLNGLQAVVLGVRAFNVRDKIASALPALNQYMQNGGTVIVQYNRPDKLKADNFAPYALHLSGDRITDQTAKPTFLAPHSALLNSPNKITDADFLGWVQERGLYFANKWDEHFTPLIAFSDPGEQPLKGGLLVAPVGKGHFIYTGLGFFRQLPAGVPGAYRLLANLIAASDARN